MRCLITTSYSVLELNTNTGQKHCIHQGDGLYYGLAQNEHNIYVAARKRMVSSNIPQSDERGEFLVFNTNLRLKKRVHAPFPLRDLHEISWFNSKLWATCSYDNMVAIWDGKNWQQWFPLSEALDSPRDIHHYNSFMFEEDKVWVLAHNHGQSELFSFSLQDYSLLQRINLGTQAHNIWREQNQLYTCSSGDGMIIGDKGFILKLGGFPRGYCHDRQERCVGISELAERQKRDLATGKVLVFDMKWKLLKTISLHKEGLLLDILPLQNAYSTGHTYRI